MPTNPKRRTGTKPNQRLAAQKKSASSAPTNSGEEQEWHEGHVSDLDALRSYDPLFIRCRQYPEVYEWCVAIHHLLLQSQYAGRWAERTSSQGDSGIEYTKSSTKLVSTCRVIQQSVRNMIDLDPEPLLLVQARRFRSKQLGGLSGMDAALSLGRWLNNGFACIGIDAKPTRAIRCPPVRCGRSAPAAPRRGRASTASRWKPSVSPSPANRLAARSWSFAGLAITATNARATVSTSWQRWVRPWLQSTSSSTAFDCEQMQP